MDNFLRKINLVKDITIQLPVSKIDFTEKFRNNVDESDLSFVPFEVFQSSKNEYKGNIDGSAFELKKRRRLFDTNYSFAEVTGSLIEKNDNLVIDAEILGFKKRMIIIFAFIVLFYLIIFTAMLLGGDTISFIFLPFLLFHMAIMLGIPYLVIRRSVNRMAYDLERDFHYWVTKN
ncbi:hypothetical protein SAMN05444671_2254 [Flavobacterium sp. CF108]|jgi:hypothetical protein|uniref:hypothetical protein n=1 Tax=unclassified Flavobacterium TaxID=196869 RepID=UPI0008AAEF6F|nr:MULTISPECIES: hypothetical protein [unclassified Flavobacterium]SEN85131.1 hypothetical protein SAMN04487978_1570 [Flavobacterium sp. fv08]SHH20650.1 hypothetical protein SAMN05444671_2254 [Flavobacterium sp. CF108]